VALLVSSDVPVIAPLVLVSVGRSNSRSPLRDGEAIRPRGFNKTDGLLWILEANGAGEGLPSIAVETYF